MKNKFLAILIALLTILGVGLAVAPSASAVDGPTVLSGPRNSVENSYLSNANILVCGTSGKCHTLLPGQVVFQDIYWNPTQVAVGAYQDILYRVLKDDYVGPWGGVQGGTTGTWLNVENLQNFFGGGVRVQIIMDDPR